jgi:hypothetical protein
MPKHTHILNAASKPARYRLRDHRRAQRHPAHRQDPVSWPKKASKLPTDVTEDVVREVALPMGLVDIKVCAVDEIWSGLKPVIRKALR